MTNPRWLQLSLSRGSLPALAILLVLVAVPLATPHSAVASDDGGGRSVFADGAGARPLALGSAYAALAEDASSVLWNPAGLGRMQRYELQGTQTNLVGFGLNEQYASIAMPNWRLGVFSLTFRHFGVGGIEQRDDRNVLLDDDLSDKETELILGYGRDLGPAWSLGAALKLRSHSLAGTSDSGLGLDLGVQVRPLVAFGSSSSRAEDFSLGLSVRNALEPTIRLDQDAVPDPRGFRFGAAYTYRLGQESALLGILDVEKTKNMNTRLHAGLEARPVPLLALRLGLKNGTLVAGAGIRWKDYGIDYYFEDLKPTNIHGIGVSIHFGATRDEKRQAAMQREEEVLKHRLDEALVETSRRRTSELLREMEYALRFDDLEQASAALAMLKVIDPDNSALPSLEASLLVAEAQKLETAGDYSGAEVALVQALALNPDNSVASGLLVRVRNASDREATRSAEIRDRLDRAMDAFAAGRLLEARSGFQEVLATNPNDAEAGTMLRRTEDAIGRRSDELISQARLLTVAGEYDAAESSLNEARQLTPQNREINEAAQFLADEKLTASLAASRPARSAQPEGTAGTQAPQGATVTPAAVVVAAPVISPQKRQEMADMYRRGIEAIERGENVEAVHYWEIVWATDPGYQQVSEYLKQQYLTRGMEAFVAGRLETAIASWEDAVRVDPEDDRAQGYLARANEQLNRMQQMDNGTN